VDGQRLKPRPFQIPKYVTAHLYGVYRLKLDNSLTCKLGDKSKHWKFADGIFELKDAVELVA